MKKNIFVFLTFIISSFVLSAQNKNPISTEPIELNYADGKELFNICKKNPAIKINDKKTYYWYTNYGGIQSTKGGIGGALLHGKYQVFSKTGKLINESNYNLGIPNGTERKWNEDGDIIETVKFNNGEMTYWKFLDSTGYTIEYIGPIYTKGTIRNIYKFTEIVERDKYLEPFKLYTKTYYQGSYGKQLKAEYTKSISEYYWDSYKTFYKNGKPKVIGKFIENSRDSVWTFYNEDGTIDGIEKYKVYREFYQNKKIKVIGSYILNENKVWIKFGTWVYNYESGDLNKMEDYENGELVKTW